MNCPTCNKEMSIGGNHMFEDYELSGEGMVTNASCVAEDCDTYVEIYQGVGENLLKEEEDEEDEEDDLKNAYKTNELFNSSLGF
tara:strand:- start:335 stop:586 length:252 start_codon:yes stop_codon:yes gene_type:complete